MAELILNSVEFPLSQVKEGPPRKVGSMNDSFNGLLRNSIRKKFRVWTVQAVCVDTAEKEAILAAIANELPITASGDALGGTFTVSVEDNGSDMIPGVVPIAWILNLTVREVGYLPLFES